MLSLWRVTQANRVRSRLDGDHGFSVAGTEWWKERTVCEPVVVDFCERFYSVERLILTLEVYHISFYESWRDSAKLPDPKCAMNNEKLWRDLKTLPLSLLMRSRRTGSRHRFQCRDLWSQKCDTEVCTKIPRLPVKRQYSLPDNLVTSVNLADWKFPYKYSDLLRTMSVTISTESETGSFKKVDGMVTSGEGRVDNFGTMKSSNMQSLEYQRNTYLWAKRCELY